MLGHFIIVILVAAIYAATIFLIASSYDLGGDPYTAFTFGYFLENKCYLVHSPNFIGALLLKFFYPQLIIGRI